MTVRAVGIQIGAGALFERRSARRGPANTRRRIAVEASQQALCRPVLELTRAVAPPRVFAVELPGAGADRLQLLRRVIGHMAAAALVHVGHDVHDVLDPGRVDETHLAIVAGDLEGGLRLGRVPDVGQRPPAVVVAHQQARLDERNLVEIEHARRVQRRLPFHPGDCEASRLCLPGLLVVKGLADNRTHREVERTVGRVAGTLAGRHPDRAQLQGIVGKQRRVEVVGRNAFVELEGPAIGEHDAPLAEPGRGSVDCVQRYRPRRLAAGAQQRGQRNEERDASHHYPSGARSTTGSSLSCPQLCWSAPTTMSELPLGRSAFRTWASPLSTQIA